jgi:hypothetical protein
VRVTRAERERERRERVLRALLKDLAKAAHNNEPWYVWIRDEWPRIRGNNSARKSVGSS